MQRLQLTVVLGYVFLFSVFNEVIFMSTKEQIYNIIDSFSDEQLTQVYTIIAGVKKLLDDDIADDIFCRKLYEDYLNDPDPEKDESISLESFMREIGI